MSRCSISPDKYLLAFGIVYTYNYSYNVLYLPTHIFSSAFFTKPHHMIRNDIKLYLINYENEADEY